MNKEHELYLRVPIEMRRALEREPFDAIDAQNREFLAGLDNPNFVRSTKMDPTRNSAERHIHDADEIIAIYPQGEFCRDTACASVESTKLLLDRLAAEYPPKIIKPLTQAFYSHFQLWFNDIVKSVPSNRFVKELFDSEARLLTAIATFNVEMTDYDLKRTRNRKTSAYTPRSRAAEDELTQDDVAADFNVSRLTVLRWESGQQNPWGYYKELRLNPDLRGAYALLVAAAKAYNQAKADAKAKGIRFRLSFVRFNEAFLNHNKNFAP